MYSEEIGTSELSPLSSNDPNGTTLTHKDKELLNTIPLTPHDG